MPLTRYLNAFPPLSALQWSTAMSLQLLVVTHILPLSLQSAGAVCAAEPLPEGLPAAVRAAPL